MRVQLAGAFRSAPDEVRTFESADVPALGDLMYRAYVGTVDYEGETPEQAAAEILRTIQGAYGEFVPGCSKVLARQGSLLSAALITRFQGRPFVAFAFTDPACAGQGLARACMEAAMNELTLQGERELRLVVTLANVPAVRLYAGLGFQVEPPDRGIGKETPVA